MEQVRIWVFYWSNTDWTGVWSQVSPLTLIPESLLHAVPFFFFHFLLFQCFSSSLLFQFFISYFFLILLLFLLLPYVNIITHTTCVNLNEIWELDPHLSPIFFHILNNKYDSLILFNFKVISHLEKKKFGANLYKIRRMKNQESKLITTSCWFFTFLIFFYKINYCTILSKNVCI